MRLTIGIYKRNRKDETKNNAIVAVDKKKSEFLRTYGTTVTTTIIIK